MATTTSRIEGRAAGRNAARARRRAEILDAALALLVERGYEGTSMLAIAERARASKETLYAWFGDKRGLFAALVRENAAAANRGLEQAMAGPGAAPAAVLERFGADFLCLILGERAVALNRTAIAAAATLGELGRLLVANGRERTGALMVRYLEAQRAAGRLAFADAEGAFGVLLGLLLRDWQIRALLGELAPPAEEAIRARAAEATALFLKLFGTEGAS